MPAQFTIEMTETKLGVHLEAFLPEVQKQLQITIGRLTQRLLAQVQALEPQRTGRLRASTHSYLDVRPRFVRGRVRIIATGHAQSIAAAFGALEYGGPGQRRSGPVSVRASRRGRTSVTAYERRRPHIRARRFLRGPAGAMMSNARAEIEQAINQAIAGFNK
jgi:hypothetical protein